MNVNVVDVGLREAQPNLRGLNYRIDIGITAIYSAYFAYGDARKAIIRNL